MVRVHPRPGQSDQLLQKNVNNMNVFKFQKHQIFPTKSRHLHIVKESLVAPLTDNIQMFLILRRG